MAVTVAFDAVKSPVATIDAVGEFSVNVSVSVTVTSRDADADSDWSSETLGVSIRVRVTVAVAVCCSVTVWVRRSTVSDSLCVSVVTLVGVGCGAVVSCMDTVREVSSVSVMVVASVTVAVVVLNASLLLGGRVEETVRVSENVSVGNTVEESPLCDTVGCRVTVTVAEVVRAPCDCVTLHESVSLRGDDAVVD